MGSTSNNVSDQPKPSTASPHGRQPSIRNDGQSGSPDQPGNHRDAEEARPKDLWPLNHSQRDGMQPNAGPPVPEILEQEAKRSASGIRELGIGRMTGSRPLPEHPDELPHPLDLAERLQVPGNLSVRVPDQIPDGRPIPLGQLASEDGFEIHQRRYQALDVPLRELAPRQAGQMRRYRHPIAVPIDAVSHQALQGGVAA